MEPEPDQDQEGLTGDYLRSVRESRGISLDELSRSTRISTRYLEAIEADAFDRLPSAIFVKGYLKQVLEQLALDDNSIVESFMASYRASRA
jgi:cytoskeleton protein RodZ